MDRGQSASKDRRGYDAHSPEDTVAHRPSEDPVGAEEEAEVVWAGAAEVACRSEHIAPTPDLSRAQAGTLAEAGAGEVGAAEMEAAC